MSMAELYEVIALVNRDGILVEMVALVVAPVRTKVLLIFIQHNRLHQSMIINAHVNFKHYVITDSY